MIEPSDIDWKDLSSSDEEPSGPSAEMVTTQAIPVIHAVSGTRLVLAGSTMRLCEICNHDLSRSQVSILHEKDLLVVRTAGCGMYAQDFGRAS